MGVFGKGLSYLLRDFSGWTSTHGVPHIGMANSQWLRFFWIFVVLACFGGFLWQLDILLNKYFSYSVNTETKLQFSERVFPTVTICHLNPYKKKDGDPSALPDVQSLINAYGNADSGYPSSSLYGFASGLTGERQQRATKWTSMLFERIMNDPMGATHAYSYDDIVVSCTYNAQTCNITDFVTFEDPTYGMCQMFNFDARYSSSRAGPLYGLRMVMRTDQLEYLPWVEASGVVVSIQGSEDRPFPDVSGYYAPPGTASSMGVQFVSTSRLPTPYGDCTVEEEMQSEYYNGTYEVEACFRACLQENIVKTCGCYDPALAFDQLDVPSCYIRPVDAASAAIPNTAIGCINQFTNPDSDSTFNLIRDCTCPQPCNIDSYSATVSTAKWPSSQYTPAECNAPPASDGSDPWTKAGIDCVTWYQENTLLIEIYYERMNYQVLTESPAYSFVNLISDIGGQVGLFLGMSIISVIEFLTLLLLLFCYCTTHKQRKREIEHIHAEMEKEKANTQAMKERSRQRKLAKRAAEAEAEAQGGNDNPVYDNDPHDMVVPPPVQDAIN